MLLIFDGHSSHIGLELIQLAQEHDVHLLCFPSHTSHLLQPLDVGVFKALKSAFNKACKRYMAENPCSVVRSENIASLLAHAWPQSVTPVNIMSGFRKCGIHPLNPGVIDDRQTAPSQAVVGEMVQKEQDSPTVSLSKSVDSTPGSGLTTVSPPLRSQCSESSGTGLPQELSDILVLPKPKERGATRRGVNCNAVCITEPEFVEQMKSKELEKQKKLEEAEQKRLERERKRIEKEIKKQRRDRERKARERRKERTLHAEKREFNLWMRLKGTIVNAQFVEITLRMMKKIGSGLAVIGAFAGGPLVGSTSQKYLWTSTALTVSEMILVHYTCNVCMQSFSCSF